MPIRLPLKAYRIAPRKPWVDVDRRTTTMRLPAYFSGRKWEVPTSNIAVVHLTKEIVEAIDGNDYFAGGVLIPYLFTTGPYTAPTTTLLFKTPQKIAPLRLMATSAPNTDIGVGFFESRSEKGGTIDGVSLRFADAEQAVDAFVAEGAERVTDIDAWFRTNRRLGTPAEKAASDSTYRRAKWIARAQYLFLALGLVSFWIGGEDTPWWSFILGMVCILLSIVARPLASRMMTKTRKAQQSRRRG